jgi:hypothetical protein
MRDDTLEQHRKECCVDFPFCFTTLATVLFAALGNGVFSFFLLSSDSPDNWERDESSKTIAQ